MRVGFDAKRLFFNTTGLGVYSRLLVRGLASHHESPEIILFSRDPIDSIFYSQFQDLTIRPGGGIWWRTFQMKSDILAERCHLFHGLSHEIPIGFEKTGIPSIVTMHDIIFKKDPYLYRWLDRQIYDFKWRYACQHADHIVAVSNHTKIDLMQVYKVPEHKISVIGPPIDLDFGQKLTEEETIESSKNLRLPQNYFLYVSSITPRKNLSGILDAMAMQEAGHRIPLVVAGSGGSYLSEMRSKVGDLKLTKLVTFTGHISNDDLPYLYTGAVALIYPSFYEGFGIPIVESLLCGTPVITSQTSSMPEVAGPGALYVNPAKPETIAQAMTQILEQDDLRSHLVKEGQTHVQQFGIDRVCDHMIEIYKQMHL